MDNTEITLTGVIDILEDGFKEELTTTFDMLIGRYEVGEDVLATIPFDGVMGLSATKDEQLKEYSITYVMKEKEIIPLENFWIPPMVFNASTN